MAKAADRIVEAQNLSHTLVSAASAKRQPLRFHQTPVAKPKPFRENFICSYHQRFGPEACNCRPGCLFAKLLPSRQASKKTATSGKRQRRPPVTAAGGGYMNSTLSVWNCLTDTHFLVDSGADVCVFPVPTPNKRQSPSGHLTASNGSKINTWGLHKLTLNFGNKRTYKQDFYFADVPCPILGANFFATNNVAIDLRGCHLIDLNYCISFLADVEKETITFCGLTLNSATQFDQFLLKFPDILLPKFQATVNKHGVEP